MRILIMTLVLGLMLSACSKNTACTNVSPASEDSTLKAYAAANNLTMTKHSSGLYYQIVTEGAKGRPTVNSQIFVTYKGQKLDGAIFDQQSNPGATGFSLLSLIEGWRLTIPMIGKGGSIKILLPSGLAYGCQGAPNSSDSNKNIPPNTPLYFELSLVDFF